MEYLYYFVVLLAAYLVAASMAPKPQIPKPAALEDFSVPTAEEGREVAVVFGTCTVTGPNVVWFGNLSAQPIRKEGGKK